MDFQSNDTKNSRDLALLHLLLTFRPEALKAKAWQLSGFQGWHQTQCKGRSWAQVTRRGHETKAQMMPGLHVHLRSLALILRTQAALKKT